MPTHPLMPIENIDDWEMRLARQDACWAGEILDRPTVTIEVRKPTPERPQPQGSHATLRDRWLDTDFVVEGWLAHVANTDYLGDALPHAYPNLGPDLFASFFGCELEFGESTSWSVPNLHDWAQADQLVCDTNSFYARKTMEITDALLQAGKGKFYTGMTDWHVGGDCIAAFRDPMELNFDMLEAREEVKALLPRVTQAYFRVFNSYYDHLTAAGQAIGTWSGIVSNKKWYIPSNDFSCMISKPQFDEIFLPGIAEECRFYEASLYHLDGPNALHHLDSLLDIPDLNAFQWVYGAGHGRASDWLPVYRKMRAAGKGLELFVYPDELDLFFTELRPEGIFLQVGDVTSREEAEAIIKRVAAWR